MQALRLLRGHFDIPYANIYLYKRVPHGAGLGGGSSNGAAVLMAANAAFDLNIGERQLALYAAMLGSDCAFFVHGIPMLAHGRGEILTPVPFSLHGYWLLAVKADISINTAAAYSRVVPCGERPDLQDIIGQPIWAWRGLLVNDFEAAAFGDYPILAHIKARMYDLGALYASMTGSGSAIYGIFGSPPYQAQHEFAKYITYCQQF
jgi:4-diphosphocytidyl-2-C-methyl-D-erythritol kinase